jgi:hypothetical protein
VPPIGSAIALPERTAQRVRAQAEAHAELENAGKRARARHPGHQGLHDAEPGVRLHNADETEHCGRCHDAIGVESNSELVAAAPARAEILDVAGLEAGVHRAPPVGDGDRVPLARLQ